MPGTTERIVFPSAALALAWRVSELLNNVSSPRVDVERREAPEVVLERVRQRIARIRLAAKEHTNHGFKKPPGRLARR